MPIFATEIMLFGTVYIKASTQEKAENVMRRLCSNVIDARDRTWFEYNAPEVMPRVKFADCFTLDATLLPIKLVEVSERHVALAQRNFFMGRRETVIADADHPRKFDDMFVYTDDIEVTTTAFVRADTIDQATAIMVNLKRVRVDLDDEYWRWFSDLGLNDEENDDLPMVLSSALYLVGPVSETMARSWPEPTYSRMADGQLVEDIIEPKFNPEWGFVEDFV
jgi:hypothetical protein